MTRKSESSTSIDDPFNQFIANLKKEMKNELELKVYEDSQRSFSSSRNSTTSNSRSQLLKNELKGSSKSSTHLALPSLTTSLSKLGFSVPKLRLKDLKVELDDDHFQNRDYLKWGSLRSTFASPDQIEAEESRSKTKFKLPPINSPRFGDANDDVDGKLKNDLYKLNDSILKKIKNELGPAITLKSDPAKNKRLKLPLLPGITVAEGKTSRSLDEIKGELIELNKKIDKVGPGKNSNLSDAERKAKEKLKLISKEFQKELDDSMDPKILIKTPRSPKKNPPKSDGEIEKVETGSKSDRKSANFSSEKQKKVQFSDGSTSTVSDNESFVSEMRSFLEDYEKKPTRESKPELEMEPEELTSSLDNYGSGRPRTAGSSSTIKRIPMSMSMMSRSVESSTDQDNSQLKSDMTTMTNPIIKKISLLDRWKIESLPLDAESLKQLQTTQTSSKENENAGNCVNAFFHGNGPRSLMDLRGERDLSYTDQILLRKLRESPQTQIQI